jgi:hypothetical protein
MQWVAPASASLLERGRLEPSWLAAFEDRATRIMSGPPSSLWTCSDFVGLHFASLYLPIRLKVSGSTLASSQAEVQRVHERSEEVLWTAATSTELGNLRPQEELLVDLAFGLRRPSLASRPSSDWCAVVGAGANALRPLWATETSIPFWPALAAHYLSFFLDFYFSVPDPVELAGGPDWLRNLDEAKVVDLGDPIRVLRTWFALSGPDRDSSGLPVNSPRRNRLPSLIPRTALETLLLSTRLGQDRRAPLVL